MWTPLALHHFSPHQPFSLSWTNGLRCSQSKKFFAQSCLPSHPPSHLWRNPWEHVPPPRASGSPTFPRPQRPFHSPSDCSSVAPHLATYLLPLLPLWTHVPSWLPGASPLLAAFLLCCLLSLFPLLFFNLSFGRISSLQKSGKNSTVNTLISFI